MDKAEDSIVDAEDIGGGSGKYEMVLTYNMSPGALKMKSGPRAQTK